MQIGLHVIVFQSIVMIYVRRVGISLLLIAELLAGQLSGHPTLSISTQCK